MIGYKSKDIIIVITLHYQWWSYPQIPLDHHDSIFKLPCSGKESPKGIQKIVATQVSPQSEMVSMSDLGAWHFNHYRQASRFHVAMIVMIQLQSWRTVATGCFFTPLRYLAPSNCTAKSAKSASSQINGWSVDDHLMTWEELLSYLRLPRKESPKGSGPIREP